MSNIRENIRLFCALAILAGLLQTSCMDASISLIESGKDSLPSITIEKQRTEPDFVVGEVVTTGNGVVIKGAFGEVSEKIQLSNGAKVEGVFYE